MAQDTHKKYTVVASYEIIATEAELHELKRALLHLDGLPNIGMLHSNVETTKVMQKDAPPAGTYNPGITNPTPIKPRRVAESTADPDAARNKPEIDEIVAEISATLQVPHEVVRTMARSQAKRDSCTLLAALRRQRLRLPPRDEPVSTSTPEPEMTFIGTFHESRITPTTVNDLERDLHPIAILRYSREFRTITLRDGSDVTVRSGFVNYNGHDYWFPSKVSE